MARDDATGSYSTNNRNLPGWVRSAAYLIGMLGFPILVAGYFLARDAGLLSSPLSETRAAMADMRTAVVTLVAHEEQRDRLLRAICRHTAKTEAEKWDCDPIRGRSP